MSLKFGKALTYRFKSKKQLRKIIDSIGISELKNHIIYHENEEKLFNELTTEFTLIQAAGGLVINEYEEILLIYRNDKWDLPKGKIEPNELENDAAIREVQEETGIAVEALLHKIIDTYHTYILKRTKILKRNVWYLMHAKKSDRFKPQHEEGIQKVAWVKPEDIQIYLQNSYASINEVVYAYFSSKKE
jgi:8-oxo-dGTP pyrophosphatase MutT (NUDIX family)